MILTCPNCGTQYVVKDDAIPPEGRQVRCAACKHSWHQDPEVATGTEIETAAELRPGSEASPAAEPVDRTGEDESLAEATMVDPRSGPEAEERAYEESVLEQPAEIAAAEPVAPEPIAESEEAGAPAIAEDWKEPPEAEAAPDVFSPFAAPDEAEPRRRSPLLTILIIFVVIVAAAAAFWFLAPVSLKARLGLGSAGTTPLELVMTNMVLQQLESGNQLLTLSGRVVNPTNKEQDVPPLQARLRDPAGKVIYTWTINPPTRSLPAGGSATFNSAEVNVPRGGKDVVIAPVAPTV